jgi:aldehyde dehydrogenase (NAD+)
MKNLETQSRDIHNIPAWAGQAVSRQRSFFDARGTREYQFRLEQLEKLKQSVVDHRQDVVLALKADIGRPELEAYYEILGVLEEIKYAIKHLHAWMKPRRVVTSALAQPGRSRIEYTPKGVVFLMGPYNYPFLLCLQPLVGSIAAGNCTILQPSPLTRATSRLISKMVGELFPEEYVRVFEGDIEVASRLLEEKFDHIFFTGSPRVGRIVMAAAARHLTPVTLELGGKSPAIVHSDCDLKVAVRRIISGKMLNAGQTCVAPDHVFVHAAIKDAFISEATRVLKEFFGNDPSQSPDFGRLINDRHFERVKSLIDPLKVVVGGQTDKASKYIAPTLMRDVSIDDAVMREEIFGPVLPVLTYDSLSEVFEQVRKLPRHPLALYLFTNSKAVEQKVLGNIQFGGSCINNTVIHVGNSHLPFGGVGESGMGSYHGVHSFEVFSHQRSILKSATFIDLKLRYAPYGNKVKLMRWFTR